MLQGMLLITFCITALQSEIRSYRKKNPFNYLSLTSSAFHMYRGFVNYCRISDSQNLSTSHHSRNPRLVSNK